MKIKHTEFLHECIAKNDGGAMGRRSVSLILLTSAYGWPQHACTFQLLTIGTKAACLFDCYVKN